MRVLIVEDTESLRWLFTRFLRRLGFEVCEAEDGKRALDVLETFEPDVIVTDLTMPVIDGVELIRRVRVNRAVPIIAMTADGSLEMEQKARRAGATLIIVKPVDFSVLIKCLRIVAS